jgi:hypothetical protein
MTFQSFALDALCPFGLDLLKNYFFLLGFSQRDFWMQGGFKPCFQPISL